MQRMFGILTLVAALIVMPSCVSMNGKQAVIEGGTGAVIGGVLGLAVGATVGHPNMGARIGAGIGATTGTTHGLFNRDEEIIEGQRETIAKEQQTQDALALSNQALTQVLQNQQSGVTIPRSAVKATQPPVAAPAVSPDKPKAPAVSPQKPVIVKSTKLRTGALCKRDEMEIYNAASVGIRVKLGRDAVGTLVAPQMAACLPQDPIFVMPETVPPNDWVVKTETAKRVIIQDSDFFKK